MRINTDDVRDAPSLAIIRALKGAGTTIRAYDAEGLEPAKPLLKNVELSASPWTATKAADALVIVTDWDEFRALSLEWTAQILKRPLLANLQHLFVGCDEADWLHDLGKRPPPPDRRRPAASLHEMAQAAA